MAKRRGEDGVADAGIEDSRFLLEEAGRIARVGGWEIDLVRNTLGWTRVVHGIHEVEPGFHPTVEIAIGFYAPEAVPVISEAVRRAIEEGEPFDLELQLITARGRRLWVRAKGEAVRESGKVVKVRGVFQDIDARKLAELRAEAPAARKVALVQAIGRIYRTALTSDSEERLGATCLAAAEELTGSAFGLLDEINPRGLLDVIAISDPGWAACRMTNPRAVLRDIPIRGLHAAVIQQNRGLLCNDPANQPGRVGLPEGHPPVDCLLGVPLRDGDDIFGLVAVANKPGGYTEEDRDDLQALAVAILEALKRHRAEVALAVEKERLAVTLCSIGDGVIATDTSGFVTLMNPVAEQLTGWKVEEARGRSVTEVFRIVDEKTRRPCEDPVQKVLASGLVVGLANHTILISRDGRERLLADSGAPIRDCLSRVVGVVLVFQDMTDRQKLENEPQRAQRLESVGLLAGGIAHDFNNLLTGILGNVALAKIAAEDSRIRAWLTEAENAVMRARDLTQQLLTLSKGGAPVRRSARLGEMIMDSATFALRGSKVRCTFDIPADLRPAEIDEGQMSQVISNLVINADEAMPDGGQIRVSAQNIEPAGVPLLPLAPGRYVEIAVEDQGIGIPDAILQRVFDPYFTTKQKGSGLGLTICHSIMQKHDGHLTVTSAQGAGSTFRMYLPAAMGAPEDKAEPHGALTGAGRILVMDDEEMVRFVTGQILAHLGYEIESAHDGVEAIEMYASAMAAGRRFDAVIADLTIPGGMGGREAVRRLREIDPEVKAIVSSGYSTDPIMAQYRLHGFVGVVVKPFTVRELGRVLRDVLGVPNEGDDP